MTPPAIIAKLNAILADPIDSECKVVYVLCEVRKLLERVSAPQRPFALNMYCHWALHIDLDHRGTIIQFLQQVDAFVDGVLVGPEDIGASNRMFSEFILLDTFRKQLREFFDASGIRTDLTDDNARWNEFVTHYAGIIEDGSLALHAKDQGLKHVKHVTFTKGMDAIGEFAQIPFDMVWRVKLLDERSIDVTVNARPPTDGVGQMIFRDLHLRTPNG